MRKYILSLIFLACFLSNRSAAQPDVNHNGLSEPSELVTLVQVGLRKIDLDYNRSRKVDQFGNQFKYRAKVKDAQGAQLGRWAWDVWLMTLRQ